MKNKIFNLLLFGTVLLAPSCVQDIDESKVSGHKTEYVFYPCLEDADQSTKLIGDASQINQLRTVIYSESEGNLTHINTLTDTWNKVRKNGVNLSLDSGNTYKILFWAEDRNNTAYDFKGDGYIAADYADYLTAGFSRMEELDAFYGTSQITAGSMDNAPKKIVLKRPVAQLNFIDKSKPLSGNHVSKVTFHSIPVSFNPFTGAVRSTDHLDSTDDLTFVFTDFPTETLDKCHYLSSNYFFSPTEGLGEAECTIELIEDRQTINTYEFKGKNSIPFAQSIKSNVDVDMVPTVNEWSVWNGKYPKVCTLTTDPYNSDCYIIDDAEDIAWLCDAAHTSTLGTGKTFRMTVDVDMAQKPGQMSIKLPSGSTFDGNNHTLKGFKVLVGIFGDTAENLTLKNITIDNSIVSGTTKSNRGLLVNTLTGSSTFTNVTVSDSRVSTLEGAAGGMIGYISRKSKSERAEKMDILFDNCHVINTIVEGSSNEGYFVGILRGYDNGETLTFTPSCTMTPPSDAENLNSVYVEGNESVWLASTDYSKYNAWLGIEECYRAIVKFGQKRFMLKWDGVTEIKPLLADPAYDDSPDFKVEAGEKRVVIYSAFDLVGTRSKISTAPTAMYIKTDIDLNGPGEDGISNVPMDFPSGAMSDDDNYFKGFSYIDYLDGQNHTIYNMNMRTTVEGTSIATAFIRGTRKDTQTVHKNLKMSGCHVYGVVKEIEDDEIDFQDASRGAIFIVQPAISGTGIYTMDNIHVYNSRVYAIQGIGILASHFRGNMSNCSVNNCYIENYECKNHLEPFTNTTSIAGGTVTVTASFYSYGEVGGLCGMIIGEANLSNNHVRGTTINAYGQDDQNASITGDNTVGNLAATSASAMGFFLVPGRHVSTLIGDIRTKTGETITINGCTADSATKCYPKQYRHSTEVQSIGQAYYIQFMDTMGTVVIDGHTLTLADGNRNTIRK